MEFTKEEFLQCVDRELLAEKLAKKILEGKKDLVYDEFNNETLKAIKETGFEVVKQIMTEYDVADKLIYRVRTIMEGITKVEILKILSGKISQDSI